MRWRIVEQNWPAFFEHIEARWPRVEEEALIRIGGDRKSFIAYLSDIQDLTHDDASEEIDAWLEGDLPTDIFMDERHDNESIRQSGRQIHPGEDVYDDDRLFGDDDREEPPVGRTDE